MIILEKMFRLDDHRDIFFMRHLCTFLMFYIGVFFFYLLCKYHFDSWVIGLLGSLFLILSPRIFAHSFYNSKDLAFLSMFIIGIYTLVKYLDKKTLLRASFHALTCAILIDIRMVGILVPGLTLMFVCLDSLKPISTKENSKDTIKSLLVYVFLLMWEFYGFSCSLNIMVTVDGKYKSRIEKIDYPKIDYVLDLPYRGTEG